MAENLDEAVVVIQEAANKLNSATKQFEGYGGKQDELISSVKELTEKVADLEEAQTAAALRVKGSSNKKTRSVSLYDRVRATNSTNY